MNYYRFDTIADAVLLANLRRIVAELAAARLSARAISLHAKGEVALYNQFHDPKVLLGQLNRFLVEHDLPPVAGDDTKIIR